jgi:hypothetical protein
LKILEGWALVDEAKEYGMAPQRLGVFGGKGIAAKMAALLDAMGPVEKDGHDRHLNRRYITTDAMMAAVRDGARKVGLATSCRQRVLEWGVKENGTYYALAEVVFVFSDPDTGEHEEIIGIGMGEDKGARVVNIAVTYASKNALRAGFLMGDDLESDASDGQGWTRAGASQRSPAARPPAGSLSPAQAQEIRGLLAGVPGDHVRAFLADLDATTPAEIAASRFDEARARASQLPRAAGRRAS